MKYHHAFMNIRREKNSEFAFVISFKHFLIVVQCILFLLIVNHVRICTQIRIHQANLFSMHDSNISRSRCHQSPIPRKSLFYVVICSFCVSSCDEKNLKWIFIPYDVLWNWCIYILSPEAQGYKTHNSLHNTSYGIWDPIYMYIYVYVFWACIPSP